MNQTSGRGYWKVIRRFVVWSVLVASCGAFIFDFIWLEPSTAADFELDDGAPPVAATIAFENVRMETAGRDRMLADLVVDVKSVRDVKFNGDAAFSVRTVHNDVHWLRTRASECSRAEDGGISDERTAYTATIQFRCSGVELAAEVRRDELWYPFDGYDAVLKLNGCVNRSAPCDLSEGPPVIPIRVTSIRVEPDDVHLKASVSRLVDQSVSLTLRRRYFLRLVSFVFLVMVLIFLAYLVRVVDPKETMAKALGVFGGLWALRSLIVPDSITTFPTLVDFVILTLFCAVFGLVLLKVADA